MDARAPSLVHDVRFDHQVGVDELRRVCVVGVNATDLGRRHVDLVDRLALEKGLDLALVGQVELAAGTRHDVHESTTAQFANNGAAHHASMAGNVDSLRCVGRQAH